MLGRGHEREEGADVVPGRPAGESRRTSLAASEGDAAMNAQKRDRAGKIARSAQKMQRSTEQMEDSADRRTQLAADRTVFAAERTYAAWVRTGLDIAGERHRGEKAARGHHSRMDDPCDGEPAGAVQRLLL